MLIGTIRLCAMTACLCLERLRRSLAETWLLQPARELRWAHESTGNRNRIGRGLVLTALLPLFGLVVAAPAQEAVVPPAPADAGVVVEHFEFSYGLGHPELPPLEGLKNLAFHATRDGNVFRAPSTKGAENLTLSGIPEGSRFDSEALRGIAQEVVRWYNSRGLYGVWVAFQDLEAAGAGVADRRAPDDHTARLVIWASQVAEVRTLARGQRIKTQFSVNNRKHRGIIAKSPLKAAKTPDAPGSLFRKDLLDSYLHGLSLHPGRLVEASIASAGEPGKVVLDFLVNESKPWQVYSQMTNFGTEATGVWRGRLGFQDNQLTNHDDVLNVDAISTPDLATYGSFLSYRIPVWRPAKLLARVYGSYGDFLASDVGLENLRYVGKNWLGGLEFTNRLTLPRNWSLVTALGANFNHYEIQSQLSTTTDGKTTTRPLVTGFSNFLVPFFSTTLAHDGAGWSLSANARVDKTVGNYANTSQQNGISNLGRSTVDSNWTSLRFNLTGSVYLENLFKGEQAKYLANEVSLRVRGRKLLDGTRLIPHEQEPVGGALSVRGYPESVLSADEFVSGSVEYAFHFPHVLKPGDAGKFLKWPFKWRPARPRENPDWDLVARGFYDYAYRRVTPTKATLDQASKSGEPLALVDTTMSISGAGCGLELVLKQNFSLRCDVGVALDQLRDKSQDSGKQVVVEAGAIHYYISSSFSW